MDFTKRDKALDMLVETLDREMPEGFAAVLYGSAARGDWHAARSDINLLIVLDDASPEALQRLMAAMRTWHDAGFTAPLLVSRAEWARSADVFPVEITDMRLAYRVLRGADPVAGLEVKESDLRRAVEAALRGKLIRLRQAYARFGESMPTLGGFATATVSELLVLLRCIVVLKQREPGTTPDVTIAALAPELGGAQAALAEVASHRRDPEWQCTPKVFAEYVESVRRLVEVVDAHPTGAA
jgi:hypothetical protein